MDIASISSAYTALKAIREISQLLLNAKISAEAKQRVLEVVEKLGNVQDALFYVREELIKIQDENVSQKARLKELDERLELKGRVVFERPSYWVMTEGQLDGPFCQKCFDVDSLLVRLQLNGNDTWTCLSCKSVVLGPNYKPRVIQRKSREW
jgi:ribosomal protein L37AE/L43A